MIYPNYVQAIPACNALEAGRLVLCKANVSSFGITCRVEQQPRVVFFADDALPGSRGPLVAAFDADCLSFGDRFVVGYDANQLAAVARPEVGDLVIQRGGLSLVASVGSLPCLVDLASGEVTALAAGTVARVWSISVDTWMNGRLVEVHCRG